MPRQDSIHDLRDHGVVVSNNARENMAAFTQPQYQVLAQLILDMPRSEMLFRKGTSAQLAQSPGKLHRGNPRRIKPYADYTADVICRPSPPSSRHDAF